MQPTKKPFWKSKTLWFNALTLLAIAIDAATGAGAITNADVLPWLTVGQAVVNGALRMVTTDAVQP